MMWFAPPPARSPPRCGTPTPGRSARRRTSCGGSSSRTAACRSPTSSPTRSSRTPWPPSAGGSTGCSPRWSPCGCSSARSSAPTTPAGPPSPASSPTGWRGGSGRARHGPGRTAGPGKRLPEAFLSAAACSVGRSLDAKAHPGWRWKGRRVYLFDGTTVTHAGHPGEPGRLPAGTQPEAGPRIPDRPGRGGHLAGVRGGREPRVLPVRRQGPGGGQPAPPAVGRPRPRGCPPGRQPDRQLGDHPHAPGAGPRVGQPTEQGPPDGGLPPGAAARSRTTTSSGGQSRRRSGRWTGRRTGRCRSRSPSGRRGSGSPSRASGPGRWWW